MTVTRADVLTYIEKANIVEISELVKDIEEKFGVTAAAPVAVAAAPATGGDAVAEEKTDFDVVLTSAGQAKISVIKAVRAITSLGLKEAKELVDGAPNTLKESVSKDEAATIEAKFKEVGATCEVK